MNIKINKDEDPVKQIIENSGNGFHYKVVNFLREKGWVVLVSPYYNDNVTDKQREIDIIAEKSLRLTIRPLGFARMLRLGFSLNASMWSIQ